MLKFNFFSWLLVTLGARVCMYSVMSDSVTRQIPLSVEFSSQGYWSGCYFPIPGGSSWPGDYRNTHLFLSCVGRQFSPLSHLGSLVCLHLCTQIFLNLRISCDFFSCGLLYLCFIVYLACVNLSCTLGNFCCGMWVFFAAFGASLVVTQGLWSLGAACRIFSLWCQGLVAPWPVGF